MYLACLGPFSVTDECDVVRVVADKLQFLKQSD